MAVSVAILYAGRWFGRAGQHLEEEIFQVMTRPTRCALRGGGVSRQWCTAAAGADYEPSLAAEVAQMLGPGGATHTATPGTRAASPGGAEGGGRRRRQSRPRDKTR